MTAERINNEYIEFIQEDDQKNYQGAWRMQDYIEHSQLWYKNRCISNILQVPKVYTKEIIGDFQRIVSDAYRIFTKVIQEYINCEDYRKLFPFSKELEALILIPTQSSCILPMARFDLFYHEDTGDFYFCEINTDGSSGMNEDRILNESLLLNPAHQKMLQRYEMESFELFDSWVEEFLTMFGTWEKGHTSKAPNVAIVDFLDHATLPEFEEFARRFQKRNILCEICDIRELQYRSGSLYSPNGMRIDAIYRRAVTSDIMRHYETVLPFLTAVKEQAVFLVGSFQTQIVHNKWIFHVLHQERTKQILTADEIAFVEEHIPYTDRLEKVTDVQKNKDRYVIKPMDSYASNGVYAGIGVSQNEWEDLLGKAKGGDYICQEYCPQYQTNNVDFIHGDGTVKPYINMAGLYVYNGKFAGVFSRQSDGKLIASHRNERTVPTLLLKKAR